MLADVPITPTGLIYRYRYRPMMLTKWLLPLALGVLSALPAQAAQFKLTYAGAGINFDGVLTTGPLGVNPNFAGVPTPDTYLVTGVTGTRNGVPITDVVPLGSPDALAWEAAGGSFDNLVYQSGPFVDLGGFLYKADGILYNLFYVTATDFPGSSLPLPSYSEFALINGAFVPPLSIPDGLGNFVAITATAIPEPVSLLGAVVGLGIGAAFKRRVRS